MRDLIQSGAAALMEIPQEPPHLTLQLIGEKVGGAKTPHKSPRKRTPRKPPEHVPGKHLTLSQPPERED